jgi:hypothetical protein
MPYAPKEATGDKNILCKFSYLSLRSNAKICVVETG